MASSIVGQSYQSMFNSGGRVSSVEQDGLAETELDDISKENFARDVPRLSLSDAIWRPALTANEATLTWIYSTSTVRTDLASQPYSKEKDSKVDQN